MSGNTTRMGAHGRVVIPAAVREALHLRQGDSLIVVADGQGIRLLTPAQAVREAQAMLRPYLAGKGSLSKELLRERREEVRRERRDDARRRKSAGSRRG